MLPTNEEVSSNELCKSIEGETSSELLNSNEEEGCNKILDSSEAKTSHELEENNSCKVLLESTEVKEYFKIVNSFDKED